MKKFCLIFFIIFAFNTNVLAQEESFYEMLEQIRSEVFTKPVDAMTNPPQIIYIEDDDFAHAPPQYLQFPLAIGEDDVVTQSTLTPYSQGATRRFFDANGTFTLVRQSTRVNIWTANTSVQVTPEMITRFNLIVTEMEKAFAPFTGKRVALPFGEQLPAIGDIHGDGRVNIVFRPLPSNGVFFSEDYVFFSAAGINPIAAIHIDTGLLAVGQEDRLYNTVAHEFQHLLFNLYFGKYTMVDRPDTKIDHEHLLWFDEALAELAGTLFANPGSETILTTRNFFAATNPYTGTGITKYGDFLNFNNSMKSYGMSSMHGLIMNRFADNYTRRIYDYFISNFSGNYMENYQKFQSYTMEEILGDLFNYVGLTGTSGISGETAFNYLYFMFMELFATDGGMVYGTNVPPIFDNPLSAYNLWGIRPNLGITPNNGVNGIFDSYTGNRFHNPASLPALPVLQSGNRVSLSGYNGTASNATHEMMYLLRGSTVQAPYLEIQINDPSWYTIYYVAVPNDPPGSVSSPENRTLGSNGATVHILKSDGTLNSIDTGGQNAYLFVSTLNRRVNNVQVNYSWSGENPLIPIMQQELRNLIEYAERLLEQTPVSDDGRDIPKGEHWSTLDAFITLYETISDAKKLLT